MADLAILLDWVRAAARWFHIVTAMAWIGSSFYFIALDLGLHRPPGMPAGVTGEEWQVHGGGFYHIQKYAVAPPGLPAHLTWFKWESYATWMSGAGLLVLLYWAGAQLYLVDPTVADIPIWVAIAVSGGSLVLGWFGYDALCRHLPADRPGQVTTLIFALLALAAWGYSEVFSGRAALLHLGALTATIMSGNVFLVIIPNQKIVVEDLRAGRAPDPSYGKTAKLRSLHNNYLTLPVIFLMISNHYPLAFASEWNWLIAVLVFPIGALIRHWFNTRHARAGNPHWALALAGVLFLVVVGLSTVPREAPAGDEAEDATAAGSAARIFAAAAGFEAVQDIVLGRCSMCHTNEPVWPGLWHAPKDVHLDAPGAIAAHARSIYLQAGASHAMPPGNRTFMEPAERAAIRAWYDAGRAALPPALALH